MADGYARVSGKPGGCFVITEPGVTNIATPMAEAYMDAIPMLVISPVNDPDPAGINSGRLHEITNQGKLTSPVARYLITADQAEQIPAAIHKAFQSFASECPRSVHLNIPLSIIPQVIHQQWISKSAATPNVANNQDIKQSVDLIQHAEKIVVIVGGGASHDPDNIEKLAERIAAKHSRFQFLE